MLPLDHAATTLANAHSPTGLRTLARTLGFLGEPLPLPTTLRHHLPDPLDHARLIPGPQRRACLVAATPHPDARPLVRTLAARLGRHAPHQRWLLAIAHGPHTTVATWAGAPPALDVATLTVARDHVRPSDADTLRLLAAAHDRDDDTTHQRWIDTLRRPALGDRFYQALASTLDDLATSAIPAPRTRIPDTVRRELALLTTSRLLFLAFLEAKGWLDDDRHFLRRHLEQALDRHRPLHATLLAPLCFGTLNTPTRHRAPAAHAFGRVPFLNGGLFARTPLERRFPLTFADPPLATLIADVLGGFRFTARESASDWSDAAIDPAMLGRTFESLMAATDRRRHGTFFTPPALVDDTLDRALAHTLPTAADAATRRRALNTLTILDPACGSGAFLVRALERIADLLLDAGDDRPTDQRRRDVLTRSIFGVDRHPIALWLCELRLWLAVVIDSPITDPRAVPPLPNLDHHLHIGDSLAGGDFTHARHTSTALTTLRQRYARATGHRKHTLARALDRAERTLARHALDHAIATTTRARREHLDTLRARDLFGDRPRPTAADRQARRDRRTQLRDLRTQRARLDTGDALPFRADAHFADVAASGGFALVIGNPPWVRPHHVDQATRERLRRDFAVARPAGSTPRFGLQVDLAACFTERALHLLRPGGTTALLLPAKLWRSLAGGPLRALLAHHATIRELHDLAHAPHTFDAAAYPSLLVAQRTDPTTPPDPSPITASTTTRHGRLTFHIPRATLRLTPRDDSPLLLAPPAVRRALEHARELGAPLSTHTGPPRLGVKCGVNAAFVVRILERNGPRTRITDGTRDAWIEHALLRPALRGEDLAHRRPPPLALIYPHDDGGRPLDRLPPLAARWFTPLRDRLEARADAAATTRWYALFRTDAANTHRPRLAWADIARQLAPRLLPAHDPTTPLNSCYVLPCPDHDTALALLALLSAPLTTACLTLTAEPARGHYLRCLGHSVAALPAPTPDALATHRHTLTTLGARLTTPTPRDPALDAALDHAWITTLGASPRRLAPLRRWHATLR